MEEKVHADIPAGFAGWREKKMAGGKAARGTMRVKPSVAI